MLSISCLDAFRERLQHASNSVPLQSSTKRNKNDSIQFGFENREYIFQEALIGILPMVEHVVCFEE